VKKTLLFAGAAAILGVAALQATPAVRQIVTGSEKQDPDAEPSQTAPKPATEPKANGNGAPKPKAFNPTSKGTPMAERVAVVGLLNKRNGLWRDLTLKPGQAVRIGDVVVRVRACEKTAPWESEQLTGAFVQLLVNDTDKKWRRYFSGWVYKETPSLNVVEHPIYDVWAKECQMKHPDIGPETIIIRGGQEPKAKSSRDTEA
jgi:hypothetical protein